MASNKELVDEARAIGQTLGVPVETQGLNNSALNDLVLSLKAKRDKPPAPKEPPKEPPKPAPKATPKPDAPTPVNGAMDDTAGGPPAPKPKRPQRKYEYQIAEGRSISCRAGILGPGREVRASFFGEKGQEILHALLKNGCVVHTPELARKK